MISFEDFRKGYFYSTENLTEKEENYCKEHYQRYVLKQEDDNYFEPSEEDSFVSYMLNSIFDFPNISKNQMVILIVPSFEPPTILIIEKENQEFNIRCEYFKETSIDDDNLLILNNKDLQLEKTFVEQHIGDRLLSLFNTTMNLAKTPQSGFFTLDGVMYYLIKMKNEKKIIVSKNITDINTKSGQIISLIDKIAETVKNKVNIQENVLSHFEYLE
jgi:hypothetical protein